MRVEVRRFKQRINLLVFPETGEDLEIFDEVGDLGIALEATPKLADGYGEAYILIEGKLQEEAEDAND